MLLTIEFETIGELSRKLKNLSSGIKDTDSTSFTAAVERAMATESEPAAGSEPAPEATPATPAEPMASMPEATPAQAALPKRRGRPSKSAAKPVPSSADVPPLAAEAPSPEPAAEAVGGNVVTLDRIRTAFQDLVNTGPAGMTAAREILGSFQAKRISDLKPEQFPPTLTAINKALGK